jgi:peroxiredoxin/mono/diheme cytochrome c family protein
MCLPRMGMAAVICLTSACFAVGLSASAQEKAPRDKLGKRICGVVFTDVGGKHQPLDDLKGKKAVVVIFLSFECPVSTGYAPVLAELANTYGKRGVAFVGVSVGEEETAAQTARQARELKLPFPVFADRSGATAAAFRAAITPEVFVLDSDLVLRYRGRIDDRYAARLQQKPRIGRQDLRQALDELLAGKVVSEPATLAVGCPIQRPIPSPGAGKGVTGKVTFYRDVLPILQRRCQSCHRPGEVGPFSLLTYRQAVRWAEDIKSYTQDHKMPPWKPADGPAFVGERRMPQKEIATLAAWVDGGTPAGDPKEAPPPRRFRKDWHFGPPDYVLSVPADFELAAEGPDVYRCFVLPTHFAEDKYVAAIEVRPSCRQVVHHAILFVDTRGAGRKIEERVRQRPQTNDPDQGPGYSLPLSFAFLPGFFPEGGLGGWAPGMAPRKLPPGVGYRLPKGADIVLQIHYHRNGRAVKDCTQVGLYFCKEKAVRHLQGLTVPASFLAIPAGARHYRVAGKMVLRQDCRLYAIMPHMHLLGKQIKLTMTPPGGKTRTLIHISDWDFNWQEDYFFQEPIFAPAGTRFDIEGIYDNSEGNPFNPFQPPRRILAGMATTNEMCVGFLGATAEQPGPIRYDIGVRLPGIGWLPGGGIPSFGL